MRIVAGELGSREIVAPPGEKTRPTSDRVREAIFSYLYSKRGDWEGSAVIDMYAGSGALAFEALSRGAARATLVETDRRAQRAIEDNILSFKLGGRARLLRASVESAPQMLTGQTFDVMFADPPYAALTIASRALANALHLLKHQGILVFEFSSKDEPPMFEPSSGGSCTLEETRVYGDTSVAYYVRT